VRLLDVFHRRRDTGANRPDGLIGDDGIIGRRAIRHRGGKLTLEDVESLAGLALVSRFTDAHDRRQISRKGSLCLGANEMIGLGMVSATLRMADNDVGAEAISNHFGRNVAGMGA
jgi:hypothetical protein